MTNKTPKVLSVSVSFIDPIINRSGINPPDYSILPPATMLALYGGFAACVYGVYTMKGPEEIWEGGEPPVSPAVNATINLTVQFFVIYLAQAIVRTAIGFKGSSQTLVKIDGSLTLASFTVHMAPMLCILFIGERILYIGKKNYPVVHST
jgi:hypothetical protein